MSFPLIQLHGISNHQSFSHQFTLSHQYHAPGCVNSTPVAAGMSDLGYFPEPKLQVFKFVWLGMMRLMTGRQFLSKCFLFSLIWEVRSG